MEKITLGIIGAGKIAKTHINCINYANLFLNLPYKIEIEYLYSRTKTGYLGDVSYTNDLEQLIDKVDVLDICTPNFEHYNNVILSLINNKHIYCEKPLCDDVLKEEELVEKSKKQDKFCNIALMYRCIPGIKGLKKSVEENLIGEIINFRGQLFHKSYLDENKIGWRTTEESGGGASLDLGIHLVDTLDFIFGKKLNKYQSMHNCFFKNRLEVDDHSYIELYLETGTKGKVEVSRIFAQEKDVTEIEIFGTKGSLKFTTEMPMYVKWYDFESKNISYIQCESKNYPKEAESMGWFFDSHTANLVEYFDQIYYNRRNENLATFEEANKAHKLIK